MFSILFVNFISSLGFSIILPFLVILVTNFGGNAFMYGLIGAIYPTFQFIASPILGKWSDVIGRRPILLVSQIGTLIAWILFLISLYLPVIPIIEVDSAIFGAFIITLPLLALAIARALDGATGGNVTVAQAYLADITPKEKRTENYGKFSLAANLGFIIGPAAAGILGSTILGISLPIIAAMIISAIGVFFIAKYLNESKHKTSARGPRIRFRSIFKKDYIFYMMSVYFLIFLGFNIFYTAFPIYAISSLGWSVGEMGLYFAFLGMCLAAVQGFILPKASKMFSDSTLILAGSIILASTFILLIQDSIWFLFIAAVAFALGSGIMWPSILSLLSKVAGDKLQGAIQGLSGSAGSLASIVGLILGGLLYDKFDSWTFLISAGLILVVSILSIRFFSIQKAIART